MTSAATYQQLEGFKIENGQVVACNGLGLRNMLQAGHQWLEAHVNIVNDLNIFPVPDGDTGTNMLLTMRSALQRMAEAPDHQVSTIAEAAAQGALLGARGNSGVILSQFLRGLATALAGQNHFAAEALARALELGVAQAYQSVLKPVEGTILTVARAMAEAAQQSAAMQPDLAVMLADILAAAKAAQAKTPALLPILKEAGVTDSGGQGLVFILEGAVRLVRDETLIFDPAEQPSPQLQSSMDIWQEAYGYDVQFLIEASALKVADIRADIERLGSSTLVVGDERLVRVHLHTPDPGAPLSYGTRQGLISDVVVENLQQQAERFMREHAPLARATMPVGQKLATPFDGAAADIAIIAVAPGQGLADIFQSLGASLTLFGGQAMNPSVQELTLAINQVDGDNVLLLPNHSHVIPAAEQARVVSTKNVAVVPAKTIPQGVAALLSFQPQADLAINVARMTQAIQQVRSVEIIPAARNSSYNGFNIQAEDMLGLLDHDLVSAGPSADGVTLDVLSKLAWNEYELLTVYVGQGILPAQGQALAQMINETYPELRVEVHRGDQPYARYIISVE